MKQLVINPIKNHTTLTLVQKLVWADSPIIFTSTDELGNDYIVFRPNNLEEEYYLAMYDEDTFAEIIQQEKMYPYDILLSGVNRAHLIQNKKTKKYDAEFLSKTSLAQRLKEYKNVYYRHSGSCDETHE